MTSFTTEDTDLARALRALGHPVRLRILRLLSERSGECCCTEITGAIDLAQSTVSQHLKVLLDAGIVVRTACGTRNRYAVSPQRLDALGGGVTGFLETLETRIHASSASPGLP